MSHRVSRSPEREDGSVQLAKAALLSPSKIDDEEAALPTMRRELDKSLREDLPEFKPLKGFRRFLNNDSFETMVMVTNQPPEPRRTKGGPREYLLYFNVTDHSTAPLHVFEVQIYHKNKARLPIVTPGDAILLRYFTVVALKDKGFGLRSNEESSWAVFEAGRDLAQIRGPPVEISDTEHSWGRRLKSWYGMLDDTAKAKLTGANQRMAAATKAQS